MSIVGMVDGTTGNIIETSDMFNGQKIFIGTELEWSTTATKSKKRYDVAMLIDSGVYTVDKTDGSISLIAPKEGSSLEFNENDFTEEDNVISLVNGQRIFTGTQAEWDALTTAEKKTYGQANITDDESGQFDTYSTEETKTGKVWIDGKPIYRKVFIRQNIPVAANTFFDIVDATTTTQLAIDTVISGTCFSEGAPINSTLWRKYNGAIQTYYVSQGWSIDTAIIEYTKTTD